ncbi:MAG: DUF58 domain-containing protein [Chloroflexota bacterium]
MTVAASPKLGAYVALAGLGLLTALLLRRPEPLLFATPFLLLLLVGLASAQEPSLTASLALSRSRLLEGEETILEITLAAHSAVERLEMLPRLADGLEATEPARVVTLRLVAGEERSFPYAIHARRWGGYVVGNLLLRAHDRWGLLVYEAEVATHLPVRVYPQPEQLRSAPRPAQTQALVGNDVARQSGEGIEFAEIRQYLPGDRIRRINWRVSARRGQLTVNQQHPEHNADVILFLDTFVETAQQRTGVLDLAVRAAMGLAEHFLNARDRVGLVSFGGALRWLTPAMGPIQRYRIVEALLDTQIVLTHVWKEISILPTRTLPPGALVVALTPLLDERSVTAFLNLNGRGFDLAIIEVSPLPYVRSEASVEGQLAYRLWVLQREAQHARFQRLGIAIATWQPGQPLEAVMEEVRAFQRFARRRRA